MEIYLKLVIFMLLLLVSSSAIAEVIVKPELSITIPDGWEEVSKDKLLASNQHRIKLIPSSQSEECRYAFQKITDNTNHERISIMIIFKDSGRLTAKQWELKTREAVQGYDLKKTNDNLNQYATVEDLSSSYDKNNNCIWLVAKSDLANSGKIVAVCCTFPTEKGILTISALSPEDAISPFLPTFKNIVSSIKISAGLEYKPTWIDRLHRVANYKFG